MRKLIKQMIISRKGDEINTVINANLNKGWELRGQAHTIAADDGNLYYVQQMVLYEKEEIQETPTTRAIKV